MGDILSGLGENVPESTPGPEALEFLQLIRDTVLIPKPIGRDQAALAILTALIGVNLRDGRKVSEIGDHLAAFGGGLINASIEMADELLKRLGTA